MDDHLLNATYYSPEIEEPLESTAMLGNIVHSDSPTHHHHHGPHVESAGSVGKFFRYDKEAGITLFENYSKCRIWFLFF